MKAHVAQLQLEAYGVDDLEVRSNADFVAKSEQPVPPEIEIRLTDLDEESGFAVVMEVSVSEPPEDSELLSTIPYFLAIQMVGVFSLRDSVENETREWLRQFNAPAILYGLVRSEISHFTEQGRHGEYLLPAVDFIAMAKEQLAVQEDEQRTPESAVTEEPQPT